jgi:hypothetical protein
MNTSPQEKSIKELFVGKCWEYLNDNFHKFSEANKIKIALELSKKDLPTQLTGEVKVTEMPTVKAGRLGQLQPLEFDIGEPNIGVAGNLADAGQTPANPN